VRGYLSRSWNHRNLGKILSKRHLLLMLLLLHWNYFG